jgi:TP901-1 family phage major tail protein
MTLSIEGDFIAEAQSFALHFAQSQIDVTSKDSDNWGDFLAGRKEWSIDFSGLYIYNDYAQRALKNHALAYTSLVPIALPHLHVIITMPDSQTFTGEAILESLDYEGPAEEALTYSGSLKGAGALVPSAS